MVKELQRKFTGTTMLVVTILLVLFLAVLNIVNIGLSRKDSQSVLNRIMDRNTGQIPAMAGTGAPGILLMRMILPGKI